MEPLFGDPGDAARADARRAIEAVVLVCEEPIAPQLLGQLVELAPVVVEQICHDLAAEYEAEGRGFQLVRVAGGWRYQTHPDQAAYIERFILEGQTTRLSAAALETLAIVAYKQPISRAQVGAIRGVSVDGVMRTLQQRGYITEISRDPGPGQAALFGTTSAFLTQLGIDSLDELPALGDFVPDATVVEQLEHGLRPEARLHEQLGDLGDGESDDQAGVDEVERFLAASADRDDPQDDDAPVDHTDAPNGTLGNGHGPSNGELPDAATPDDTTDR